MRCSIECTVVLLVFLAGICNGQQWSRFRGPNGSGISHAKSIPSEWTDRDYSWKVSLPGEGHSSPVIWADQVFLTSADPGSGQRTVLCLDTSDGHSLWTRDFESTTFKQHRSNGYATATPAVDAAGVIVTWTTPEQIVLLALDRQGHDLWRREFSSFIAPHRSGTSVVLVDDLVVLANSQEDMKLLSRLLGREDPNAPTGTSFVIAVDRRTGETRWKLDRQTTLAAYSTPCVRQIANGQAELILTSTGHGITAVDVASGTINWEIKDIFSDRCVSSPILADDLVIAGYGHGVRGSLCVAAQPGSSDNGDSPRIVYEVKQSVPLVPTPIFHNGLLFLWSDDGVVTCLRALTGELVWRKRVKGAFFGSPVCVDGRLYCMAKDGHVLVLAARSDYELLARVPLGDPSFSTPAVSNGVMYLRTRSHLFALGGTE